MLDVSDNITVASTLNKVYTWGDLKFNDFDPETQGYESWKKVKNVSLPSGRINKVHAHQNFSVVEMESG